MKSIITIEDDIKFSKLLEDFEFFNNNEIYKIHEYKSGHPWILDFKYLSTCYLMHDNPIDDIYIVLGCSNVHYAYFNYAMFKKDFNKFEKLLNLIKNSNTFWCFSNLLWLISCTNVLNAAKSIYPIHTGKCTKILLKIFKQKFNILNLNKIQKKFYKDELTRILEEQVGLKYVLDFDYYKKFLKKL